MLGNLCMQARTCGGKRAKYAVGILVYQELPRMTYSISLPSEILSRLSIDVYVHVAA